MCNRNRLDSSTSFLTTSRRLLQFSSPTGSAAGETSEPPSSPPSPRGMSSQSSSNLPSPVRASNRAGTQLWSLDTDLSSSRAVTLSTAPSPSTLQDNSSQDTQSSRNSFTSLHEERLSQVICLILYSQGVPSLPFPAAHDGDSVIIVNEQKGKKRESSRLVFVFVSETMFTTSLFTYNVLSNVIKSYYVSLPLHSVPCFQAELWIKEL